MIYIRIYSRSECTVLTTSLVYIKSKKELNYDKFVDLNMDHLKKNCAITVKPFLEEIILIFWI